MSIREYEPQGRHVSLHLRGPQHSHYLRKAWSHPLFMRGFHRFARPLPPDEDTLRRILEREHAAALRWPPPAIHWVVHNRQGHPLGLVSLTDIHPLHRRGELLVGLLNTQVPLRSALQQVHALAAIEATLLALAWAFGVLQLHKVTALTYADNHAPASILPRIGFTLEALYREHLFDSMNKTWIDIQSWALLASEHTVDPRLPQLRKRLGVML